MMLFSPQEASSLDWRAGEGRRHLSIWLGLNPRGETTEGGSWEATVTLTLPPASSGRDTLGRSIRNQHRNGAAGQKQGPVPAPSWLLDLGSGRASSFLPKLCPGGGYGGAGFGMPKGLFCDSHPALSWTTTLPPHAS